MATKQEQDKIQMAAWQKRFDDDFPGGLLITAYIAKEDMPDEDGDEPINAAIPYRTRRVEVQSMATPFSPTVQYTTSMGMTSKDAVRTIDTYVTEQEDPKIVRVTFTDGVTQRFSNILSDQAKRDLEHKW